jgi:hypothetical protein
MKGKSKFDAETQGENSGDLCAGEKSQIPSVTLSNV